MSITKIHGLYLFGLSTRHLNPITNWARWKIEIHCMYPNGNKLIFPILEVGDTIIFTRTMEKIRSVCIKICLNAVKLPTFHTQKLSFLEIFELFLSFQKVSIFFYFYLKHSIVILQNFFPFSRTVFVSEIIFLLNLYIRIPLT